MLCVDGQPPYRPGIFAHEHMVPWQTARALFNGIRCARVAPSDQIYTWPEQDVNEFWMREGSFQSGNQWAFKHE